MLVVYLKNLNPSNNFSFLILSEFFGVICLICVSARDSLSIIVIFVTSVDIVTVNIESALAETIRVVHVLPSLVSEVVSLLVAVCENPETWNNN